MDACRRATDVAARASTGCAPRGWPTGALAAGDPARPASRTAGRIGRSGWPRISAAGSCDDAAAAHRRGRDAVELLRPELDGLRELPDPIDPSQPLVLLDTETTGLGTGAGTLPFLVGVGTWEGERLRDPPAAAAGAVGRAGLSSPPWPTLIPPDAWLVTYNGRSFDWPLLVTRFRLHGRPAPAHAAHLDLLPLARRLWRHRLADARLASVEAGVCGVRRAHDLPGGLVPARYLDYLRSGHGGLLRDVLEHNRQDVVSMALLLRVLARDLAPVSAHAAARRVTVHPGDLGGLGRAYARRRRHEEALACFESALERLVDAWEAQRYEAIAIDRARTLTRLGLRAEAEGAWQAIALEGGRHAALAWLHVAKHREHDARRLPRGAGGHGAGARPGGAQPALRAPGPGRRA